MDGTVELFPDEAQAVGLFERDAGRLAEGLHRLADAGQEPAQAVVQVAGQTAALLFLAAQHGVDGGELFFVFQFADLLFLDEHLLFGQALAVADVAVAAPPEQNGQDAQPGKTEHISIFLPELQLLEHLILFQPDDLLFFQAGFVFGAVVVDGVAQCVVGEAIPHQLVLLPVPFVRLHIPLEQGDVG